MSQPSLVLLQLLLLVVGRVTLGAKDVSPFESEAKSRSCCRADKIDWWEPTCVENIFDKCGPDESCQFDVQLSPVDLRIPVGFGVAECVPAQSQLKCVQKPPEDPVLRAANCICAKGDSFDKCNPVEFLKTAAFEIPFCPIPPASEPDCIKSADKYDDPYCRYTVTKGGSQGFTFKLKKRFCQGSTIGRAIAKLQKGGWTSKCVPTGKDTYNCNCTGVNCVKGNLMKTLMPVVNQVKTVPPPAEIKTSTKPTAAQPEAKKTPSTTKKTFEETQQPVNPHKPETTAKQAAEESTSAKAAPGATPEPITTPSPTVPPAASDSGLSDGEIAGIVVGVILFLAIVGAALFYLRRKSKSPEIVASPPPPVDEEKIADGPKAEEIEDEDEDEDEDEEENEGQGENENETDEENEGEDDNEAEHEESD